MFKSLILSNLSNKKKKKEKFYDTKPKERMAIHRIQCLMMKYIIENKSKKLSAIRSYPLAVLLQEQITNRQMIEI